MSGSEASLAAFLRARSALEGWSSPSAAAAAEALRHAGLAVDERSAAPPAREQRDFVICAASSPDEARAWASSARHLFVLVAPNERRLGARRTDPGAMLAVAWSLGQVKEQIYLGAPPLGALATTGAKLLSESMRRRLLPEVAWVIDVTPRSVSSRRRRALALADAPLPEG